MEEIIGKIKEELSTFAVGTNKPDTPMLKIAKEIADLSLGAFTGELLTKSLLLAKAVAEVEAELFKN